MIFYSLVFLLFFVSLICLVQITKSVNQQKYVFLIANIIFYGYWDVRFLVLLASVILVCYYSAILYEKNRYSVYILLPIVYCLLLLLIFKYMNFFIDSFCKSFGIVGSHTLYIILPLGVSFYLFQAMSYVFDVKKSLINVEKDIVKIATYISFFPQITSGPIVKARDFLPQLERVHSIKKENLYEGIKLFTLGLTKKIVFADRIGVAVNAVYSSPLSYNNISIFFAIIGYSLQIYCDFSGYSDMAIGIAKILDFDLGRNFNLPYIAKNTSEFWSRWHISLSSWFKEYVYIPLGGSRKGTIITYRNIFITMLLSGIWHGANWTFIIWGIFHALGSVIQKFYADTRSSKYTMNGCIYNFLSILLNFSFVSLLWVVFRASNVKEALQVLSGLFNTTGITYINIYVVIIFVIILLVNVWAKLKNDENSILMKINLDNFFGQCLMFIWIFLIIGFMYVGDSAFIYAKF